VRPLELRSLLHWHRKPQRCDAARRLPKELSAAGLIVLCPLRANKTRRRRAAKLRRNNCHRSSKASDAMSDSFSLASANLVAAVPSRQGGLKQGVFYPELTLGPGCSAFSLR
jgi:hypothetical protein